MPLHRLLLAALPAIARSTVSLKPAIAVQGGSLRTWSYRSPIVNQVQVVLSTEGRPLDADVELWNGPDNIPCRMSVYSDDGFVRPFSAVLATPRGPNTVSVRNVGRMEFPITATVFPTNRGMRAPEFEQIQGGALATYAFEQAVDSIEVLLETDGRPLNAKLELLQGPNNNKQVIELYSEDGLDRPFACFLESAEYGCVVRVLNTGPMSYPMYASVVMQSAGLGGWLERGGWANSGMALAAGLAAASAAGLLDEAVIAAGLIS
jgi:hypothetical protein